MICSKCKDLGLKSRVTSGFGFSTAMYCAPYYDEEGVYHNHDANNHSWNYSCSNGHNFAISGHNKCCSCDFGKDSQKTTFYEDSKPIILTALTGDIAGCGSSITGECAVTKDKLNNE